MNELKVIGREHIGRIEFTGIEGGFGKDKKAMLVKDIALIHSTTIKRINELINRSRKRFKDGIDVIDLKSPDFKVVLNDLNFGSKEISNANNIYLLSEAAESITGEMTIPVLLKKEYSAGEVAKKVHASSGQMVGRIANRLGIKAEQPGQNEYGRWANSKSQHSDKEFPQWMYFEQGVKAIADELKRAKGMTV